MPQSVKPSRAERPLRRTAPWGSQVGKLDGTGGRRTASAWRPAKRPRPGSLLANGIPPSLTTLGPSGGFCRAAAWPAHTEPGQTGEVSRGAAPPPGAR